MDSMLSSWTEMPSATRRRTALWSVTMSNNEILASERGSSVGRPGNHDSLANLLDRHDPARKPDPVRDPGHANSQSPDDYDLTNPNLHHGSQSNGESGVPVQ